MRAAPGIFGLGVACARRRSVTVVVIARRDLEALVGVLDHILIVDAFGIPLPSGVLGHVATDIQGQVVLVGLRDRALGNVDILGDKKALLDDEVIGADIDDLTDLVPA